jgi:hypothetical protein
MTAALRPSVALAALVAALHLLTPAPAIGQIVLSSPLVLSPAAPAAGQSTTATFTVRNTGTAEVSIAFLFVAVRTAANTAIDFPVSHEFTLQPGQSFSYSGARSFSSAGTYTAWPGYSDGTARVQLTDMPTQFTVQQTAPPPASAATPQRHAKSSPRGICGSRAAPCRLPRAWRACLDSGLIR